MAQIVGLKTHLFPSFYWTFIFIQKVEIDLCEKTIQPTFVCIVGKCKLARINFVQHFTLLIKKLNFAARNLLSFALKIWNKFNALASFICKWYSDNKRNKLIKYLVEWMCLENYSVYNIDRPYQRNKMCIQAHMITCLPCTDKHLMCRKLQILMWKNLLVTSSKSG